MIELPKDTQDQIIAWGFAILIFLAKRARSRWDKSEPVARAVHRARVVTSTDEEVKAALERCDATWTAKWNEREDGWLLDRKAFEDRESRLTHTNLALIETNRANAEIHERAIERFGAALLSLEARLASSNEELGHWRRTAESLEAKHRTFQGELETLRTEFETERTALRRSNHSLRIELDDMTRRAEEAGVSFTSTDLDRRRRLGA